MIATFAASVGVISTSLADIIHVPGDYPTIQAGIDVAVDGDEVVLADGTYTGDGNRNINYLGKSITVRSEKGPENCIVNLQDTANRGFLFINGESAAAILDGFTIREACFDVVFEDVRGGAILIEDANPTISNCIFFGNQLVSSQQSSYGGAIFSSGSPTFTECTFQLNTTFGAISADGGAFYNDGGDPMLIDCLFDGNLSFSVLAGGGAIGGSGSIALIQCTFVDNYVESTGPANGGAVEMDSATMINCHFEANEVLASDFTGGGAVAVDSGILINCVFAANVAENGGGFYGSAGIHNCTFTRNKASLGAAIDGDGVVSNTIAWNNIGDPINGAQVTYSNIQGGWPGEGNIDADPLFVDPIGGDYRLSPGSPCIDAGDNTAVICVLSDRDGNERLADDPRTRDTGFGRPPIADMGAYEFASRPAGGGDDCNLNGLHDQCELAWGFTPDCNRNGIPDDCDPDCDGDGIPDDCQRFEDCNGNGIPDQCDEDCNLNGIPDDCEELDDCNGNGVFDSCDIADGTSNDCNENGIPDECEQPDCNTIHVPDDFQTIQAAINAAVDGDQVVIADGVYTGDGNHDIDFFGKLITVRSANGPDNCIVDLQGKFCDRGFLFVNGETSAAVLEGLTVTNARIDDIRGAMLIVNSSPTLINCVFSNLINSFNECGPDATLGGAMYSNGDPTILDCVFADNAANGVVARGGGFYNDGGDPVLIRCAFIDNNVSGQCLGIGFGTGGGFASFGGQPVLIDCHFQGNCASGNDGGVGGGIYLFQQSIATITGCTFDGNVAVRGGVDAIGGGVHASGSIVTITNCVFINNEALRGGGFSQEESSTTLVNCLFTQNDVELNGGAAACVDSSLFVINSTVARNHASVDGGGIYLAGKTASAIIWNCILWGNTDNAGGGQSAQFFLDDDVPPESLQVALSCVEGWTGKYGGAGNIDADPLFVDAENGDHRLAAGSPCIDAGRNEAVPPDEFDLDDDGDTAEPIPIDLDGNLRFVDDANTKDTGIGDPPIVDMGAYEFQVVSCPWDLDGDGNVGTGDLILLLGSWGDPYGTADLIELLGAWGPCP